MYIRGFNCVIVFFYFLVRLEHEAIAQNLLVVSKHEPATSGDLVPKSQQTLLVSPEKGKTGIKRFIFPNQINESFLPKGFLSDPVPARVVSPISPTALTPIGTTASGTGFNGITQSINGIINAINKKANLITRSIQKDISKQASGLSGLIKSSAHEQINAILQSAIGGIDKKNNINEPTQLVRRTGSRSPVKILSVSDAQNKRRQLVPLVVRKNIQRINDNKGSPRSTAVSNKASTPLVLSSRDRNNNRVNLLHISSVRLPANLRRGTPSTSVSRAIGRPLITSNRASTVLQRATSNSAASVPRVTVPLVRQTNTLNRPSLVNSIRTIVNRQQTNRNQQGNRNQQRNRNTQATRPQIIRTTGVVPNRQRQTENNDRSRERCPSRDECRRIVPANCRRPTYVTDDNGRRICRGCDEDRCTFGGFERRWGRGFG